MTPLDCPEGTDIIVQGDKDARTFYVLERGSCDVYIKVGNNPADGMKKVHQYSAARWAHAFQNHDACGILLKLMSASQTCAFTA